MTQDFTRRERSAFFVSGNRSTKFATLAAQNGDRGAVNVNLDPANRRAWARAAILSQLAG
jgi:hypothetical protein